MSKKTASSNSIADTLVDLLTPSDGTFDLADVALVLAAHDTPNTDLNSYRTHLKSLYDAVEETAGQMTLDDTNPAPSDMAEALSKVIAGTFRYRGDEENYDDLDNANLMRVIDRRKGLPVALGILYIAAARSQGWNVAGLNFPGHFLVRLESLDGNRVIIDPFHEGQILETPALRDLLKVVTGPTEELESRHYSPVSDRDILVRLQNNVKTRRLDLGQMEEALETLKSMQLLMPDSSALCRETGFLHLRLGQVSEALSALEDYLNRAPQGPERSRIDTVVKDLKQRIH
ncbi:MAG: SirB1 family protein [Rhodospirillaceae bacterium]|jgi:regulator of sirC expression with transglutaminase-like and TPR domain